MFSYDLDLYRQLGLFKDPGSTDHLVQPCKTDGPRVADPESQISQGEASTAIL